MHSRSALVLCLNRFLASLLIAACAMLSAHAQTVHFSGAIAYLGSGFKFPFGVAVDRSGNVFIADSGNSAVNEIMAAGGYTTVKTLGSGFSFPHGVAVDANDNVFVADTDNGAIKEIVAAGGYIVVKTLGGGFALPGGVGVDGHGNVFVADTHNGLGLVKEIPAGCITGANNASCVLTLGGGFLSPTGVAVDGSGDVFVADQANNKIKEIPANCIAGANNASCVLTLGGGFSNPTGVAVDGSGNVFVGDTSNNQVKEILAGGGYTTVKTLGTAFFDPLGVAVDGSGNVFVAAGDNSEVPEIVSASSFGPVSIGSTSVNPLSLSFTFDTAGTWNSALALTQGANLQEFNIVSTGTSCTYNGTTSCNPGDTVNVDVTFKPIRPGPRYGAVELLDGSGNVLATGYAQGTGVGPQAVFSPSSIYSLGGGFNIPIGLATDTNGNVFVADWNNNSVKEMPAGCASSTCVIKLGGGFVRPGGVAVDGGGNLYVADTGNSAVKEMPAGCGTSACVKTLGGGFSSPPGVAVDGNGNVYVADELNSAVKEMPALCASSACVVTLGGGFSQPSGVAVDGRGNVYVADTSNDAMKEMPAKCTSSACVTTLGGGFSIPAGVAVDGIGNVFVSEAYNSVVKMMPAQCASSDCVTTLASGFNQTGGVAVDSSGNVYVTETGNNAVKLIWRASPPSLSFTATPFGQTSTDSPQRVAVTNDGNAALTFPRPSAGNNPSVSKNFEWDHSSTCGQTDASSPKDFSLTAGATCTIATGFAPTVTGSITGSIILTDNTLNASGAMQTIGLSGIGIKDTPAITWAKPANITYGTALSATQLDATANVPGTFVYSPASGYVLSAGTHSLMATFTPTDTTDYNTAKGARSITVNQAAPAITWAKPADIAYGTPLSATQLDAKANVSGTFVYSPAAGTVLPLGASTLTVTFTPTNATDFTTAKATIGIWVSPATPAITWKTPANITYGTALSATQLAAAANVPGTFAYSPAAGTVLSVGAHALSATFTPTDTVHYVKATAKVSLQVVKATPAIAWTKPADITYGTALSATQLDATANVPGTFVYSPAAGTLLSAGANTLSVTFTPTNTADYNTAKATVGIWVYQAAPTITWATPAPIAAGTALSSTQLDAAVTGVDGKTLAGTSVYSPAAGTVLAAGKHTLTVTFTPTSSDYKKATASVTLTVQ